MRTHEEQLTLRKTNGEKLLAAVKVTHKLEKQRDEAFDEALKFLNSLPIEDIDIEVPDENGDTPLSLAIRSSDRENGSKLSERLLELGANFNLVVKQNYNIFLLACIYNHDIALKIIDKIKDVNFKDLVHTTPLIRACGFHYRQKQNSSEELIRQLLERGANPNVVSVYGEVPLSLVCSNANPENFELVSRVVKLLLKHGADINNEFLDESYRNSRYLTVKTSDNKQSQHLLYASGDHSPLHSAIKNDNDKLLELLIDAGAKTNIKHDGEPLVFWTIRTGKTKSAKMLINKGVDINDVVNYVSPLDGTNLLWWACRNEYPELAKQLIEANADVNVINKKTHETPLIWAAGNDLTELVEMLLAKGAKVGVVATDGTNALYWACNNLNLAMAKQLVSAGANVNTVDKDGNTPIFLACEHNNYEMVKLLVEHGAQLNVQNKAGKIPILLAAEHNNQALVELLLAKDAVVRKSPSNLDAGAVSRTMGWDKEQLNERFLPFKLQNGTHGGWLHRDCVKTNYWQELSNNGIGPSASIMSRIEGIPNQEAFRNVFVHLIFPQLVATPRDIAAIQCVAKTDKDEEITDERFSLNKHNQAFKKIVDDGLKNFKSREDERIGQSTADIMSGKWL